MREMVLEFSSHHVDHIRHMETEVFSKDHLHVADVNLMLGREERDESYITLTRINKLEMTRLHFEEKNEHANQILGPKIETSLNIMSHEKCNNVSR